MHYELNIKYELIRFLDFRPFMVFLSSFKELSLKPSSYSPFNQKNKNKPIPFLPI